MIDDYAPILGWLSQNSNLKGKVPVPLLTNRGNYKCEDGEGIYMLYDFIDGETVGEKMTAAQVARLSEIIAELHSYGEEIPVNTDRVKEDFDVPFCGSSRLPWIRIASGCQAMLKQWFSRTWNRFVIGSIG